MIAMSSDTDKVLEQYFDGKNIEELDPAQLANYFMLARRNKTGAPVGFSKDTRVHFGRYFQQNMELEGGLGKFIKFIADDLEFNVDGYSISPEVLAFPGNYWVVDKARLKYREYLAQQAKKQENDEIENLFWS